ncbi:MAG: PAS domain S-box protein [Telluria sp.]
MSYEAIYHNSPILLFLVDENMLIVHCSQTAETLLGSRAPGALAQVLDADSVMSVHALMHAVRPADPPVSCRIKIVAHDGVALSFACLVDKLDGGKDGKKPGQALLRITAMYDPDGQRAAAALAKSERLLRDLVESASEAMWCIEFTDPIDLAAGTQEVVRQVFTNECHWLMCNKSMTRLYDLPADVDFEKQAVSLYFQRNVENEAFVSQIVDSGFSIDNALSVDVRHDGAIIYVENTVRAHIHDGRLIRLWGTVRDVTGYRQIQNRLQQQVENVHGVLGAIPYALLVIDRSRILLGVNPAFEREFGWRAEQLLGRDIQALIDLENALPGERQWYGCDRQQWVSAVRTLSGSIVLCDAWISPVGDEAPDQFVLTLCPIGPGAPKPPDSGA